MSKLRIALLVRHPRLISDDFLAALAGFGERVDLPENASTKILAGILAGCDVAVTGWESPLLPLPQKNWRLRYICHMTGELKRIVPANYFESGIQVTNWGDIFSFATAEGTVALLFGVLKELPALDARIRESGNAGDCPRPFCTLCKTRVGIYGLSTIGRLVAQSLKPFGPVLSFYDPTVKEAPEGLIRYQSLDGLFMNNDIVTVHAGLNEHTRATVDYRRLAMLPPGGALINTARGAIVVEQDLARILNEGKIRAGIDVIEDEKDWRTSPLLACPNTLLSGHTMSKIGPLERTVLQENALDNLRRFRDGEPLKHLLTLERYRMMT
jgi:phosphoglycerate dehydrogenase-like enzyme